MSDMSFIRKELNAMYEVRNRFMELEQLIQQSTIYPTEHIQELNKAVNELSNTIIPLIETKLYEEFELRKQLLHAELNAISETITREIHKNETLLETIQTFLDKTFDNGDEDDSRNIDPSNPPKPRVDPPSKGFFFGGMK